MAIDIKKYYFRVRNSKFAKDVSFVFIANLTSNAINFISFIIIARFLTNDDFGRLALIMAIINGISDISNLGMNATTIRFTAIFKSKNEHDRINVLLSTVFTNILVISILVIIIFFFASGFLTDLLLKNPEYTSYLLLSSFGIGIALFYSFFSSVFQGLQRFNSYMYFTLTLSVLKIILIIVLYFVNAFSLLNVFLIIAFTPVFSILASKFWLRDYKVNPFLYNRSMVKETFGFSKWMFLWSICAIFQSRISTYLLASLTTMTQVSFYDMAKKFSNIIMFGLNSYSSVLGTRMASITDRDELKNKVKQSRKITVIITVLLAASILLLPLGLKIFFSDKYDGSILPLRIILGGLIFFIWTFPYNSALYSLGKSKVFFYQALLGLIVESILSYLFVPAYGAVGASVSYVITYAIVMVVSILYYRKYIKQTV